MAHYKIWDNKACFTTHVIRNHTPVFCAPDYFRTICDSLLHCREHMGLKVFGYVIMPDHLHLLTGAGSVEAMQKTLAEFRRFTGKQILQMLADEQKEWALARVKTGPHDASLWETNYRPVDASENAFEQKLVYIHLNPVRTGFVASPKQWLYSSARNYILHEEWPIPIDNFFEIVSRGLWGSGAYWQGSAG